MNRRAAGISLFAIAALLYSARYLTAAIFGSNLQTWDSALFRAMLEYTQSGLNTWSIIALLLGVIYLVWSEIETLAAKRKP